MTVNYYLKRKGMGKRKIMFTISQKGGTILVHKQRKERSQRRKEKLLRAESSSISEQRI